MTFKKALLKVGFFGAWLSACNGELVVDSSSGPVSRWMGNAPECPSEMVTPASPCSLDEGQTCAWSFPMPGSGGFEQAACACQEAPGSEMRWYCYLSGSSLALCPEVQPEQGSSCWGFRDQTCSYPRRNECSCREVDGDLVWNCATRRTSADGKSVSTAVDGSKAIDQLDDEERRALCEWILSLNLWPPGSPPLPDPGIGPDGISLRSGCVSSSEAFPCNARFPILPVSYCMANLSLSTCEAPASELEDCVLTMRDECTPAPHGCARYLEKPGCDGTIVKAGIAPYPNMDCGVRVQ